jgi:hypothetical protein
LHHFYYRHHSQQSHCQWQVLALTLQLSLKVPGDSSASRRAPQSAADSSEDSEDDVDEKAASSVDQDDQQMLREQQHLENVRIDQELRNLRQEQADAAENLLQKVIIFLFCR